MLVACWSVKGGVGTTVVASALAVLNARSDEQGALLVDLTGDAALALGAAEPAGPGVQQWLGSGPGVPADALGRLEVAIGQHLALLPQGHLPGGVPSPALEPVEAAPARAELLARILGEDPRTVVVDCGVVRDSWSPAAVLAGAAASSLLVLRPCYLAIRHAMDAPLRASGVVLVDEPGRALAAADLEATLGVPVVAVVAYDPALARAVDRGLVGARLPRGAARALRGAGVRR